MNTFLIVLGVVLGVIVVLSLGVYIGVLAGVRWLGDIIESISGRK